MDYFIAIVPTIYTNPASFWSWPILTSQYSVTDHVRVMEQESNEFPGIFFKYDLEPITIRVTTGRGSFIHFVTRISGIIGGVFIILGAVLKVFRFIAGSTTRTSS